MTLRGVTTDSAPVPSGSYSQGIAANGFLFLAGQGPYKPDGSLVVGSIESQLRQVFENLEAVALEAGTSLRRAVRVSVYLSDLKHFEEMDQAYRQFVGAPLPARTTIQTDLVDFDVEADAIVLLGD